MHVLSDPGMLKDTAVSGMFKNTSELVESDAVDTVKLDLLPSQVPLIGSAWAGKAPT